MPIPFEAVPDQDIIYGGLRAAEIVERLFDFYWTVADF
jgi:hypothetical protein